jgi:hypothetical protein
MKRITHCLTAVIAAFLALLFVTGVVHSTDGPDPARPWYGFTRIVTITLESASDPLTPALNSLWQLESINLITNVYNIPLPTDAYSINVKLSAGDYVIEPGPTIVFTGSQPWFYLDYRTNQRALRVGNQILITQTAGNTQQFRYLATLIFTAPYQYIGTSGNSPIAVTSPNIQWDIVPALGAGPVHRIDISTWLGDPRLPDSDRPDLEILTATLKGLSLNQVQVSAVIHNGGVTTTVAPPYLNLYDYLAPSTPPTSPVNVTYSWCSLYPATHCAGGTPNPLPILNAGATVTVTAEYTLSSRSGTHDLYFLVDGLGGDLGLNWESIETNNWKFAGSQFYSTVFLPLVQHD